MNPPQPPSDPYGGAYPPPSDPYGQPQQQPYGPPQPPHGQPQPPYGAPQQPYQPYGVPEPSSSWQYESTPPPHAPPPMPYQPVYPPPQAAKVNGFAIASLIFGICGGLLFSVIFGIVALSQIRRRGGRGRGMAIAGLVLSVLWAAVIAIGGILAYQDGAKRDSAGNVTEPGSVQLTSLEKGDCINMDKLQAGVELTRIPAIPCTDPHDAEIYAIFKLTGSAWPGDAKITEQAEAGCTSRMKTFLPSKAAQDRYDIYFLHPIQSGWTRGDREVTCVAAVLTGKLTGPIKPA